VCKQSRKGYTLGEVPRSSGTHVVHLPWMQVQWLPKCAG
jgi:hypothetical protein